MRPKVPKDYERAYLHCRTFGHSWQVGDGYTEGASFYRFVLVCGQCKTRRLDAVNRRTGTVVANSRRYEYPPGYQANKDEGLARTVYRIEFIRRLDDG